MKRNSFSNLPAETHLALPVLRRYLADTLPGPERYQVEKHLLDCEMCADILAGMEQNPEAKTNAAVQEINRRLATTIARKKKTALPAYNWQNWGVAATILLLLASVFTIYFNLNNLGKQRKDQSIAISVPEPKETFKLRPADPPVIKQATPEANPAAVAPTKSSEVIQQPERAKIKPQPEQFPVASAPTAAYNPEADNLSSPQATGKNILLSTDTTNAVATGAGFAQGKTSTVARTRLQAKTSIEKETVSGQVLDASSGEPLPGVSVQVKGTVTGTTTDNQGKFSLPLPESQSPVTLVYSFIGYTTTEKLITDPRLALANVTLSVDTKQLSETVVVGYGSYKPGNVTIAVKNAKPKGGLKTFKKYVQQNLKYPTDAQAKKIQGRVVVGFTVNLDGSVSELNIIKSLSPDCDAEAMRLVQEGPPWEPTRFNNKPVVQQVQAAIRFKLPKK